MVRFLISRRLWLSMSRSSRIFIVELINNVFNIRPNVMRPDEYFQYCCTGRRWCKLNCWYYGGMPSLNVGCVDPGLPKSRLFYIYNFYSWTAHSHILHRRCHHFHLFHPPSPHLIQQQQQERRRLLQLHHITIAQDRLDIITGYVYFHRGV